ncbi:MAG: anthranilate synthase component 1 [Myxococcota bacterium]|nr:anthranilate synthase component 1 [Myxococcota bacterium]
MQARTLATELPYHGDTLALFKRAVGQKPDTQLFESKDGNGQNNTQSLLFLQSALRIEGRGQNVDITPLTPNGQFALDQMVPHLSAIAEVDHKDDGVVVHFPSGMRSGSDKDRIQARSTTDVLRIACRGWRSNPDKDGLIFAPGVFAYDYLDQFEVLPKARVDIRGFADFVFWLPETIIIVYHIEGKATIVHHLYGKQRISERENEAGNVLDRIATYVKDADASGDRDAATSTDPSQALDLPVDVDLSDDQYGALVETCKEHIVAGDVFQIVPSRTFSTPCADPLAAYGNLRRSNPSPYLFFVAAPGFTLLGSSPETCVSVKGTPAKIQLHPIAGTRPRGFAANGTIDPDLDNRLEAELKLNEKELAEHMMLVDLARNDVARICRSGTRQVLRLLEVERYSQVMHLVSVVEGTLKEDLDAMHAYVASMNMGTLVGAPKIEAARLLRKYEVDKRGPYGGAVGYFNDKGELDMAIVIRAALVVDGTAYVRAGAGVVYDSDPKAEATETRNKAKAVLKAIALTAS